MASVDFIDYSKIRLSNGYFSSSAWEGINNLGDAVLQDSQKLLIIIKIYNYKYIF